MTMTRFFRTVSRISMATLGNALLGGVAAAIALCGIALAALYLIKYVDDDTPEMIRLQCAVGISRPDCVDYQKELDDLAAQRAALAKELAALKAKLANLKRIEENVDSVTLFDTTDIPNSSLSVTVGTRYSKLLEPELRPTYFCYIDLPDVDGVDQNLYIRSISSNIDIGEHALRLAGVSQSDLSFARSVCKPFLIGEAP
jgi:hypothetical protein